MILEAPERRQTGHDVLEREIRVRIAEQRLRYVHLPFGLLSNVPFLLHAVFHHNVRVQIKDVRELFHRPRHVRIVYHKGSRNLLQIAVVRFDLVEREAVVDALLRRRFKRDVLRCRSFPFRRHLLHDKEVVVVPDVPLPDPGGCQRGTRRYRLLPAVIFHPDFSVRAVGPQLLDVPQTVFDVLHFLVELLVRLRTISVDGREVHHHLRRIAAPPVAVATLVRSEVRPQVVRPDRRITVAREIAYDALVTFLLGRRRRLLFRFRRVGHRGRRPARFSPSVLPVGDVGDGGFAGHRVRYDGRFEVGVLLLVVLGDVVGDDALEVAVAALERFLQPVSALVLSDVTHVLAPKIKTSDDKIEVKNLEAAKDVSKLKKKNVKAVNDKSRG